MTDRKSIVVLRSIEEKLDSAHLMLEKLIAAQSTEKLVKLSNEWSEAEDSSGEWNRHGLSLRLSRGLIDKYIPSLKWFLLGGLGWSAGWFSKLFHEWMSKI